MKIHYFEKGWELNPKRGKKAMLEKRNKEKDFDFSVSGKAHQVDEYYLKKDVDKILNK